MKAALRARAAELGFDVCRVTTAAPPASAARFVAWLAAGHHGEMAYLARQAPKRADPQLVLSGARSVICLAASYHTLSGFEPDRGRFGADATARCPSGLGRLAEPARSPACGVVARYARFNDYHDVLAEKLRALTDFVNRLGGPQTKSLWYVDTGPVLERDLAERAGVGFIGKNTNLISQGLGNWFFLAEILTTLELAPDPPERNRCGTCTRCLAACPTGAIRAPFVLDARRCISYLTIELKGPIPVELRPAIGRRIFGCDDCLEVCPWNRFAREGRLLREHTRADLATLELVELLALDDAGFKARFAGTPLLRARRRGLLRNVCVALGNAGDPRALPALTRAAADSEPLIAEHALWALERLTRQSDCG